MGYDEDQNFDEALEDLLKWFDEQKDLCQHIYKDYVGFTEVYKYCIKCNKKVYKK